MLKLRKTYNTRTGKRFFFANGKSISKSTYDEKYEKATRKLKLRSIETFRHGHAYIKGTPLISTERIYVRW